jgi:hypothetical protein
MSFTTDQTRLIIQWLDGNRGLLSDAISWHIDTAGRQIPLVEILIPNGRRQDIGSEMKASKAFVDSDGAFVTCYEAVLHDSLDFKVVMRAFAHDSTYQQVAS